MTTVYIPLFAPNLAGKRFSLAGGNPGVGGSQFTTVQFAMMLAEARPDWKVVVGNAQPLDLESSAPNLSQEASTDLSSFCQGPCDRSDAVVVLMSVHFWIADPARLLAGRGHHVIWSRHPFDAALLLPEVRRADVDVVSVGEYQWRSNMRPWLRNHYIQEAYLPAPDIGSPARPSTAEAAPVRALHVSSMVPAKGFLDVAKAWAALKRAVPGVCLEVIGGSSLYGRSATHPLIPVERSFGEDILRHIPVADIQQGRVRFHGTLGHEKLGVMQGCSFALLNPTGASEAFPATPLESMSMGIPVIASDDFGMADCMRYFPELTVQGSARIAERAAWLIADRWRYRALQARARAVAASFALQTESSMGRWIQLVESIASRTERPRLVASLPLHGSAGTLLRRREVDPRLRSLKWKAIHLVGADRGHDAPKG
jgi:glycosyltransferase involved in cell wall biosynthesis